MIFISFPYNYIASIQTNQIILKQVDEVLEKKLLTVRNVQKRKADDPSEIYWSIQVQHEAELANVLCQLRDWGASFIGGPGGWPPAAVFEHMRERGLVHGNFTEIVKLNPERWVQRKK